MARTLFLSGKIGPAFRATATMHLDEVDISLQSIALNEGFTESSNVLSTLIASLGRSAVDVLLYDSTKRVAYCDFSYSN